MPGCPKCGTEANHTARYCPRCGASLADRLCANGHIMEPDWDTCRYCPPATNPATTRVIKPTRVVSPLKPVPADPASAKTRPGATTQLYGGTKREGGGELVGWLVITEGKDKWKDYRIAQEQMVLGRDRECDVVVEDPRASARHASLRLREGSISLTDLDSSNGTFVNGARISRIELDDGAEIKIGDTFLRFRKF